MNSTPSRFKTSAIASGTLISSSSSAGTQRLFGAVTLWGSPTPAVTPHREIVPFLSPALSLGRLVPSPWRRERVRGRVVARVPEPPAPALLSPPWEEGGFLPKQRNI